MTTRQFDDVTLTLTDRQLRLLVQGEQLTTDLDGVKATIACGDSTTECDTLFATVDFASGAVLVQTNRDVIGRLLDGTISRMGAYVYDRKRHVLGNLTIRMVLADPTPEELATSGSDVLGRILAIAAEPGAR